MPPTETSTTIRERVESTRETDRTGDACPECQGRTLTDEPRGEVVCRDCGLVVDETVLVSNRARTDPGDDSDVGRVGSPTSPRFHDRGLTTVIDGGDRDANGNRLSQRKLSRVRRLRTWNARCLARNGAERSLQFGLSELERMASVVGLSETVREVASVVLRRAHEADVQRGRSLEATATAALYAAARSEDLPLTIDTVAEASRVDRRSFVRAYREAVRELSLEIGPPDPTDHVAAIASDLDASDEVARRARSLLDAAKSDDYHVGKHPSGMAAAAVYAAGLVEEAGLTQLEVSDAADVCTVTIRDHYSAMLDEWRADA